MHNPRFRTRSGGSFRFEPELRPPHAEDALILKRIHTHTHAHTWFNKVILRAQSVPRNCFPHIQMVENADKHGYRVSGCWHVAVLREGTVRLGGKSNWANIKRGHTNTQIHMVQTGTSFSNAWVNLGVSHMALAISYSGKNVTHTLRMLPVYSICLRKRKGETRAKVTV